MTKKYRLYAACKVFFYYSTVKRPCVEAIRKEYQLLTREDEDDDETEEGDREEEKEKRNS